MTERAQNGNTIESKRETKTTANEEKKTHTHRKWKHTSKLLSAEIKIQSKI